MEHHEPAHPSCPTERPAVDWVKKTNAHWDCFWNFLSPYTPIYTDVNVVHSCARVFPSKVNSWKILASWRNLVVPCRCLCEWSNALIDKF